MTDAPPPAYDPYAAQQPAPQGGKGLAITALVFGVLALLLSWTVFGGIILGLVALVLGVIASSRAKKGRGSGRGLAITGIVLGVVGLLISIAFIVVTALFLGSDTAQNLRQCVEQAQTQSEIDACSQEFEDQLSN